MGKIDLKFFASTVGSLGVIFGIGGHCANIWMANFPSLAADATGFSDAFQWAIYVGTVLWMWSLALLARSRGHSALWALSGALMVVPIVGLVPWFLLMALEDNNNVEEEIIRQAKANLLERPEGYGPVIVRYASDFLDRDLNSYGGGAMPYDPWAQATSGRKKATKTQAIEFRPAIINDAKYRW